MRWRKIPPWGAVGRRAASFNGWVIRIGEEAENRGGGAIPHQGLIMATMKGKENEKKGKRTIQGRPNATRA